MDLSFSTLNIVAQCKKNHVPLWTCAPFLFIIMGGINVAGMITTGFIAQRFSDDPAVVVISVSIMTAFLFVVGNAVVSSFQRLADASRIKSEFVSIVSHQLRSPLSAIRWQLEIVLDNLRNVPPETHDTIVTIKHQNERMIDLVNDLLEVNRIEDDRIILRPVSLVFDVFVDQVVKNYQPLAHQSKINLALKIDAERLGVFADEAKLRWVTENLLDNALRYTKAGGEISVRVFQEGSFARVEVADNGVGIPLADQKMIFTKFFRANNALRLRAEGTGLGLFLVKSLVKTMGGKVGFASLEGKGSIFWFTLPLVGSAKASKTKETKPVQTLAMAEKVEQK